MFELKLITKSNSTLDSIEANDNLYERIEGKPKFYRIDSEAISLTDKFETFRFPPINRKNIIFIIAIPENCNEEQFINFLGSFVQTIKSILFIKEPITNFFKALIKFDSQDSADNFYYQFNNKSFPQNKSEFLYCAFISKIVYSKEEKEEGDVEIITTNKTSEKEKITDSSNEMSTCPLCIEKIESNSSGIEAVLNIFPCERWPNYKKNCCVCSKLTKISELKCEKCSNTKHLWSCWVCGYIGCDRYQERHAIEHFFSTHHRYSLEVNTERIWDYKSDTWIHRIIKTNEGSSLILEDKTTKEEDQLTTQEFLTRMQSVTEEYNKVLSAQLEVQRKFYIGEIEKLEQKNNGISKENLAKMKQIEGEIKNTTEKIKHNEKLIKEYTKKISQYEKKIKENNKMIEFNNELMKGLKIDNEEEKKGISINKMIEEKKEILQNKRKRKELLKKELQELYNKLSN